MISPEFLVVYYSRTGITEKVARKIIEKLDCDYEEIKVIKEKDTPFDYQEALNHTLEGNEVEIFTARVNPGEYAITIVGSPIWAGTMTPAVRAYLLRHKRNINNIAVFTTSKASSNEKVLKDTGKIMDREVNISVNFTREDVLKEKFYDKLENFIARIRDSIV